MHSQRLTDMQESGDLREDQRGVKTRLIGVVMIVLGILDSLLTLRGGLPGEGYLSLIALGAAVFAIGAMRGRRHSLRRMYNA